MVTLSPSVPILMHWSSMKRRGRRREDEEEEEEENQRMPLVVCITTQALGKDVSG